MRRLVNVLFVVLVSSLIGGALHAAEDPRILEQQGHLRRALELARTQSAAAAQDGRALALYARLVSESGKTDEALLLAERAVKLADADAEAHETLAEVCGVKAQRAGMFEAYRLAKRVRKECERAIALDPRQVEARAVLIQFHLLAPGVVGGDKKQATRLADELIAIDAERGWLSKADVARRTDTTQVEACLKKAVEASKGARARVALADFYTRGAHQDFAKARAMAEQAVAAEPARATGWALVAALAAHDGRFADLDTALGRAEAAVPDNRYPAYAAARTLVIEKREPARAERLLRRYLEQAPELQTPTEGAARWRLAQALEQQGRKAEAIAELQTAVRLEPKLEDAKKDLKRLKV